MEERFGLQQTTLSLWHAHRAYTKVCGQEARSRHAAKRTAAGTPLLTRLTGVWQALSAVFVPCGRRRELLSLRSFRFFTE